jgi:photosystem II stability/assembly factor-like uncharacterized protein
LHSLVNPRCTISNSSTIAEATFLDAQTGWAVGSNGGLFVTHDGGQTWARVGLGISDDLKHITFPDAQDGYIIGANVTVTTSAGGSVRTRAWGMRTFRRKPPG